MRRRLRLYPYKLASKSCRALKGALQDEGIRALAVREQGTRFRPRRSDLVINWSNGRAHPTIPSNMFINTPEQVMIAGNKLASLSALQLCDDVTIPKFTTSSDEAYALAQDGKTIIARDLLRANSGRGIRILTADSPRGNFTAPLYTVYVKKIAEYRVHVWDGEILDVTAKRRRVTGDEAEHSLIRNHANGYVFCREDIDPPPHVLSNAIAAVQGLQLTFGAVDIIYNRHYDTSYVLEVNTAPGMEGTTLRLYTNKITQLWRNL